MKRPVLSIYLLLSSIFLFQQAFTQTIKVGIQGGLLFTNLDVSSGITEEPPLKTWRTYQMAVPVEIGLQGIFAIQPEIMYSQHGAQFDETTNLIEGGVVTITRHTEGWIRIQTLEIPVLAKVRFGPKIFKMHLLAGPALGFGLSGKSRRLFSSTLTEANGTVSSMYMEDNKRTLVFKKDGYNPDDLTETQQAISKTNMNLHFGAGFNLNLKKMTFFLDGRYILGLTDLFPEAKVSGDQVTTSAKSRRIGLSAGILFPLKG